MTGTGSGTPKHHSCAPCESAHADCIANQDLQLKECAEMALKQLFGYRPSIRNFGSSAESCEKLLHDSRQESGSASPSLPTHFSMDFSTVAFSSDSCKGSAKVAFFERTKTLISSTAKPFLTS